MKGSDEERLDSRLERLLRATESGRAPRSAHVDPGALAAYLDGVSGWMERRRVEQHLLECAECRSVAVEAAEAIGETAPAVRPVRRAMFFSWRPALLAAASLLFAVAVWRLAPIGRSPNGGRPPETADLTEEALRAAGPEIAALATAAREGSLPVIDEFATYVGDHQTVVRGGETPERRNLYVCGPSELRQGSKAAADPLAPEPISPRCSAIRESLPTFEWRSRDPASIPTRSEIIVVDQSQEFVAGFEAPSASGSQALLQATYPATAPALDAGRMYAWKVSSLVDGKRKWSPYIPFRILAADAVAALDADLARAGQHFYVRSLVFVKYGLYDEALTALQNAPPEPKAQERARSLEARIVDLKGISR